MKPDPIYLAMSHRAAWRESGGFPLTRKNQRRALRSVAFLALGMVFGALLVLAIA